MKSNLSTCFSDGTEFINTFVKMVAHDIKLSPQEIKQWCLSDLIDMVSDIITKNDTEAFEYYFSNKQ